MQARKSLKPYLIVILRMPESAAVRLLFFDSRRRRRRRHRCRRCRRRRQSQV